MSLVAFWAGANFVAAADAPAKLQPTPENSPRVAQPQVAAPEDSVATEGVEGEPCEDFSGMSLCSPPGRVWLRADYLMWWTSGMNLPALVSTGAMDNRQTTILYGNETVNNDGHSGVRTTLGLWLDPCRVWNVEFDYMSLGERNNDFSRTSTGNPMFVRPYFDIQSNQQSYAPVAVPGTNEGSISIVAKDYFQSAGFLVSYNVCSGNSCAGACNGTCDGACGGTCGASCDASCDSSCGAPRLYCCRTDLLAGFRYYNLSDRVSIHENTQRRLFDSLLSTTYDIQDDFGARNDFYGTDLGLRTQIYRGRWSLELLSKLAIGNNHQTVTVNGQTVTTSPISTTTTAAGGVLALANPPGNMGVYERDVFTVIPQFGAELGYQLSCHWRTYIGYNIVYWGSVYRAGDQIDLDVDPRNIPSSAATQNYNPADARPLPRFLDKTTSFWAQGINLGLERRF
jgi:hypothetical protein